MVGIGGVVHHLLAGEEVLEFLRRRIEVLIQAEPFEKHVFATLSNGLHEIMCEDLGARVEACG